jgi:hypothetical protein
MFSSLVSFPADLVNFLDIVMKEKFQNLPDGVKVTAYYDALDHLISQLHVSVLPSTRKRNQHQAVHQ